MKKYFKLFIFIIVFTTQCPIMLAQGSESTQVFLAPRPKPKQGGFTKPSKSPDRHPFVPISIFLDETSRNMTVYSSSHNSISYYVYDQDEHEVSSGVLTLLENESTTLSLEMLLDGAYSILIDIDGIIYEGNFLL